MSGTMDLDLGRLRDRVAFMHREHGLSMRQISLMVAGTPDLVRHLLAGHQKGTSGARVLRLAAALQCSPDYLYGQSDTVGEPPPGITLHTPAVVVPVNISDLPSAPALASMVDVPEYDVRLSAGAGAIITEEGVRRHWGLPRSCLESIGLDPRHVAFVEIAGDSMSPALMPGDLVLLDLRSTNPALPAIYALWDGDATVCKRVEKVHGADPPQVRIISDNKAYSAYDVPAEWVRVIGRVAWYARRT